MGIKAIKGQRGEEQAFCTCRDCGGEETVSARHGHGSAPRGPGKPIMSIHSEAAVVDNLKKMGWSNIKGRLRCKKCTEARKHQEAPMVEQKSNVAPIRQPTAEQEVEIIVLLSTAYDRKAKRYKGEETDKTVAETVGGGVMPGWVAAIREAKFGPAGNQEIDAIRAELAKVREDTAARASEMLRELDKAISALTKRLDACVASHDRRVG